MFRASGQRGVPVTVIDGQVVVGYDQRRLTALLDQDTTRQVTLGISIADAARIAEKQGGGPAVGAYIGRVKAGSPAEKAGLRAGDVIPELGGRPIHTAADIHAVTAAHRPGDRLSLTLERGGREMRVMLSIS